MRTIPREVPSVKEPRRDYTPAPTSSEVRAYLQGALHDSTYNTGHRSIRFTQSSYEWLVFIQQLLQQVGNKSWIYREGRKRTVYALETTARWLEYGFDPRTLTAKKDRQAYLRGYFDAEGGFPKLQSVRTYIQLSQKSYVSLERLKKVAESVGIECGKIHNPSQRVDPTYYRFYVRAGSQQTFIREIGSWHPVKRLTMMTRMKI